LGVGLEPGNVTDIEKLSDKGPRILKLGRNPCFKVLEKLWAEKNCLTQARLKMQNIA